MSENNKNNNKYVKRVNKLNIKCCLVPQMLCVQTLMSCLSTDMKHYAYRKFRKKTKLFYLKYQQNLLTLYELIDFMVKLNTSVLNRNVFKFCIKICF